MTAPRGHRYFSTTTGGVKRLFMLAARGTHEICERESESLRRRWRYTRIVPMGPYGKLFDDYAVYVFEEVD